MKDKTVMRKLFMLKYSVVPVGSVDFFVVRDVAQGAVAGAGLWDKKRGKTQERHRPLTFHRTCGPAPLLCCYELGVNAFGTGSSKVVFKFIDPVVGQIGCVEGDAELIVRDPVVQAAGFGTRA